MLSPDQLDAHLLTAVMRECGASGTCTAEDVQQLAEQMLGEDVEIMEAFAGATVIPMPDVRASLRRLQATQFVYVTQDGRLGLGPAAIADRLRDMVHLPFAADWDAVFGGEPNSLQRRAWFAYCYRQNQAVHGLALGLLRQEAANANAQVIGLLLSDPDVLAQEVFEFFTVEYVSSLATLLIHDAQRLGLRPPVKVLEVGAGNGRLSHFLRRELQGRVMGLFEVIATDSGTDGLGADVRFAVEETPAAEAIQKHRPAIVLCSWMATTISDLVPIFQAAPTVVEYVLIGPETITGTQRERPRLDGAFERVEPALPGVRQIRRAHPDASDNPLRSSTVLYRRQSIQTAATPKGSALSKGAGSSATSRVPGPPSTLPNGGGSCAILLALAAVLGLVAAST